MNKKHKDIAKKPSRSASKTTAVYWSNKIYLEEKAGWKSATYFVRISVHGIRKKVRLDSSIREEAAREATDFYLNVLTTGWPADESGALPVPVSAGLSKNPTVGEWIDLAIQKTHVRQKSVQKYAESMRTIVSEILGMSRARKPEQRANIDAFKISDLTKKKLQAWVEVRIDKARKLDMVKSGRALNTIRSLVTNAKALFSKQLLEAVGIEEDDIRYVPFHGLKLPAKYSPGYTSRFDAKLLLESAAEGLGSPAGVVMDEDAVSRFEQWKILYLALVAGLRYNEIDKLRVQDISATAGRISIRTHETFQPKSSSSEAEVRVSAAAAKVLGQMLKRTKGTWFIKSSPPPESAEVKEKPYRADVYHEGLIVWLRNYEERGIRPFADIAKPVHELRKEAGTLVNQQHDLNEAKNFLRHSSIATTAAFYVSSKGDITTGLS